MRKLVSKIVNPNSFEAYVTCWMIPLNKNPYVRPIGIGEVLRRIILKVIGWVLKGDVQEVAGPLQTAFRTLRWSWGSDTRHENIF